MQRALEMMLDAILDTWAAASPWLADVVAEVPLWAWASLVTLVLVWAAVRLVRPTRVEAGAAPDLLLTRVELTADGPSSARFDVAVGFSNLHHEPVQLLRIAAVGSSGRPDVREVRAIVTARHAVEIESDVELRPGGRGRLDVYALVPSSPSRAWRLRVPLAWDPFGRRYTGMLLDQGMRPVRRLPEPPPEPLRSAAPYPRTEAPRAQARAARDKAPRRPEPTARTPRTAPTPARAPLPDAQRARSTGTVEPLHLDDRDGRIGLSETAAPDAATSARAGAPLDAPPDVPADVPAKVPAAFAAEVPSDVLVDAAADALTGVAPHRRPDGASDGATGTGAPDEARPEAEDRSEAAAREAFLGTAWEVQPSIAAFDRLRRGEAPGARDAGGDESAEEDEGTVRSPRTPRLRFPDRF